MKAYYELSNVRNIKNLLIHDIVLVDDFDRIIILSGIICEGDSTSGKWDGVRISGVGEATKLFTVESFLPQDIEKITMECHFTCDCIRSDTMFDLDSFVIETEDGKIDLLKNGITVSEYIADVPSPNRLTM